MDDSSSAEQYLTVPSCYIKEELDISNVTDYSDDEILYADFQRSSDTIEDDSYSIDIKNHYVIGECLDTVESEESVVLKNSVSPEKSENKAASNVSSDRIAIMKKELDDTDVDVENDSSDSESSYKSQLQEKESIFQDSIWVKESSEDEDFELKMSDDSDKEENVSKDEEKDKTKSVIDSNKLNSSKLENRVYVTRNRSKTQTPTSRSDNLNLNNPSDESKQLKSEPDNGRIMKVTRSSFKNPEDRVKHSEPTRHRIMIKKNAVIFICLKCRSTHELVSTQEKLVCTKCNIDMKYKCTLCKSREHITETYAGLHKHIKYHHILKSKRRNNRVSQINQTVDPPKQTTISPKPVTRELMLADIEKFTILICLKCNEVARVRYGKIADCNKCTIKMSLTCLICSKYEDSTKSMYEHLHQQHREHFKETQGDLSTSTNDQNDKTKERIPLVRNKRCMTCGKLFSSNGSAYRHAAECSIKTVKCDDPSLTVHKKPEKGSTSNAEKKTPTTATPDNNKCRVCGKVVTYIKNHEKYCQMQPKIKCPYKFCPYVTKFKCNLNVHVNQHHEKLKTANTPAKSKTGINVTPKPREASPALDTGKRRASNASSTPALTPIAKPLHEVAELLCHKCHDYKKIVACNGVRVCENCKTVLHYRCLVCDKTYEHYMSLIYHLDSSCNPRASYECLQCSFKTSVANLMHKHIRIHGLNPMAITDKKVTNKAYKVIKFEKSHPKKMRTKPQKIETQPQHPKNGIIKPETKVTLDSRLPLENGSTHPIEEPIAPIEPIVPISNVYQKTWSKSIKTQCPNCKIFVLGYSKHIKYCGIEANITCKLCVYKTKWIQNLKMHMKKHHKSSIKVKNNNVDNERQNVVTITTNQSETMVPNHALKKKFAHQLRAEDLMRSYCYKCDASKESTKYASKCRVCESQLAYRCAKCHLEYPTRDTLRVHVREHWRKRYLCSKCPKLFGHAENLHMHEQVCTGGIAADEEMDS